MYEMFTNIYSILTYRCRHIFCNILYVYVEYAGYVINVAKYIGYMEHLGMLHLPPKKNTTDLVLIWSRAGGKGSDLMVLASILVPALRGIPGLQFVAESWDLPYEKWVVHRMKP